MAVGAAAPGVPLVRAVRPSPARSLSDARKMPSAVLRVQNSAPFSARMHRQLSSGGEPAKRGTFPFVSSWVTSRLERMKKRPGRTGSATRGGFAQAPALRIAQAAVQLGANNKILAAQRAAIRR